MESAPKRQPADAFGAVRWRTPPLIGRDHELSFLSARLEATARGDGGVVLLSGEPGVGKSRLLSELGERAQSGGWLVLTGRSYDTDGMPPYLAFAEAIAEYLRTAPDDEAGLRLAKAAREVALLVPELSALLTDSNIGLSFGPEAERYRLFEAVSDFFLGLSLTSEKAGLLLCLDDLHWADWSTLLLFQHLVRRLKGRRLLVVGAFRTEEVDRSRPLFDVLAELAREQDNHRLTLARLSPDETSALVASLSEGASAPDLLEAIHKRTQGNPFFVQEVVRHLQSQGSDQGGAVTKAEGWSLSEGVREVIGRRIFRLGAETQKLLESAAVLGDGFESPLLRIMADLPAANVMHALEEAVQAGMLREERGGYAFGHPLIHQVIYEGLSLARRQVLHLQAAEAIESTYTAGVERHLLALATHYRLAGSSAHPARTLESTTAAAAGALALFAYDEAISLYRFALTEAERNPAVVGIGLLADLRVKLGSALYWTGSHFEALKVWQVAFELLTSEQVNQRVEVLLGLSHVHTSNLGDYEAGIRYATEALAVARSAGLDAQAGEALAAIAATEVVSGNLRQGADHFADAVAEQGLMTVVTSNVSTYLYWAGRLPEAVELGRRLPDSPSPQVLLVAKGGLGLALASSGLYDEAQAVFDEARRIGREHQIGALARAISMSSGYHLDLFDFTGAESLAQEARDLAATLSFANTISQAGIDLVLNFTRSGRIGAALELVEEVAEAVNHDRSGPHVWIVPMRMAEARAELSLARRDWHQALSLAEDVIARSRRHGRVKYESIGLQTRAQALLGLGRKREALLDMRAAVEVARPVGDPAMFFQATATLLGAESNQSIAQEAMQAVETVLAGLSNQEMRLTFEAAAPVQLVYRLVGTKTTASRTPHPSYPDSLSGREVEVLRLIASGQSNREIAGQLVVSVRTVERHITNIYPKIGARGRADATAYAFRHDLV